MNPEIPSIDDGLESRSIRLVRALTWFAILAGALSFWLLAGWVALAYLRP